MTDIEKKALALVNEIEHESGEDELTPRIMRGLIMDEALCRAIEQHEAFRQEVSDVVYRSLMSIAKGCAADAVGDLSRFVIPAPKRDPLVDVLLELELSSDLQESQHDAIEIRKALDELGFEIREKNDD